MGVDMKKRMIVKVLIVVSMLQFCVAVVMAQGVELGYSDFPYVASDGNNIGASFSGSYTSYGSSYSSCAVGITTKSGSVWLGNSGVGSMTNTFSQPVTSVTYNITGSDTGETTTFTTNAGTPTVTSIAGCTHTVAGNVLTFTGSGDGGSGAGATIEITSSTPFTSITVSHDGVGSGSLFTLFYGGGSVASIPVSPWAIAALFLILSFIGYKMLRKPAMPAV
jgi:hypothetical protein